MQLKPFNIGSVTERSMPFWPVANCLMDPFGAPVLPPISSLETCDIICQMATDGWFEKTGAHDDDLVPWNPEKPEDDLDEKSETYSMLQAIKEKLEESGVGVNTITCNLHSNPIFRRGGLTNPDFGIRELARLKVERTLRIGNLLGAHHFTYWVARDGWEVPGAVPWTNVYSWLREGLNHVCWYMAENHLSNYKGGTIEPKPNEPRGHMFLPTAGHAVGFIEHYLRPSAFWGVNPELTQHEGMTLLDSQTTVAYLIEMNKLSYLHLGNQIKGEFDNDFPPLVGPEGLKETIYMFWVLQQMDWKGVVEFDCHMLRSEADPTDPTGCRKQFIKNCSVALSVALKLAERIGDASWQDISESEADILNTLKICKLDFAEIVEQAGKKKIITPYD